MSDFHRVLAAELRRENHSILNTLLIKCSQFELSQESSRISSLDKWCLLCRSSKIMMVSWYDTVDEVRYLRLHGMPLINPPQNLFIRFWVCLDTFTASHLNCQWSQTSHQEHRAAENREILSTEYQFVSSWILAIDKLNITVVIYWLVWRVYIFVWWVMSVSCNQVVLNIRTQSFGTRGIHSPWPNLIVREDDEDLSPNLASQSFLDFQQHLSCTKSLNFFFFLFLWWLYKSCSKAHHEWTSMLLRWKVCIERCRNVSSGSMDAMETID